MIPQTLATLTGFLFLVAPGIVFDMLRERRRPGLEQTSFREASGIALASLVFSVLAVLILSGLRTFVPTILPDLGQWLQQGGRYVEANYRLIAGFFLAELSLAVGLAALAAWFMGRKQPASIRQVPTWYTVFQAQRPAGSTVFVRVLLTGNVEYYGTVIGYSTDYQLADRELLLGSPLYRRLADETTASEVRSPWCRLIIPGAAIQSIWVSFLSNELSSAAPSGAQPTADTRRQTGHGLVEASDYGGALDFRV